MTLLVMSDGERVGAVITEMNDGDGEQVCLESPTRKGRMEQSDQRVPVEQSGGGGEANGGW